MTAHSLTVNPWGDSHVQLVCGCGGWNAVCAPGAGERAGRQHHLDHINEAIAEIMRAEQLEEMEKQLRAGETWVYLPYGRMRHIIDGSPSLGYSWSNCHRQPSLFSAWLGTGSEREVDQLVKLPPCPSCIKGRS